MRMPQSANEDWQRYCLPMLHSVLFLWKDTKRLNVGLRHLLPDNKETEGKATKDPTKANGGEKKDDVIRREPVSLGL